MESLKLSTSLTASLLLLALFITPTEALAVPIQNLNGATGPNQTFQSDSNVTISTNPSTKTHSLGWTGYLPISRGGTGVGSFTAGSLLFSNGSTFVENNSKLFWDNTNNRLGIGTSSPTTTLDVSGNAKVTSLNTTNDSTFNEINVGKGGANVGSNTAIGVGVLSSTSAAGGNTAVGYGSMAGGQFSGEKNTAVGTSTLQANTTGSYNTAFGQNALEFNTTGIFNVGLGYVALELNNTGSRNTAVGVGALLTSTGSGNTAIGNDALTNAASDDNSIIIGQGAIGAGTNKAVIGNSNITDVYFGSSSGLAKIHAANIATVSSGTSAPSSTPTALGQIYIDTSAAKVYISTGTSSSADWTIVN